MNRVAAARLWLGLLVLSGLLAATSACRPIPYAPTEGQQASVDELLQRSRTQEEISDVLGASPSCVDVPGARVLCEWQLGSRSSAWAGLAAAIATRDKLRLLCVLPEDGGPRDPGSCTAYPRRSVRELWKPPEQTARRAGAGAPAADASIRERELLEQRTARAENKMASARDVIGMSRLLGAAPSSCMELDAYTRRCLWRLSNATYGHGIVAAWAGVTPRKRVRLTCDFPLDGGPRDPGSCSAVEGG